MILLSVLVPNYNHAQFLPRCLDSIFGQADPACEVIVCDDGSSDQSLGILQEYQARFSNLTVLRNPKNLGVMATVSRLYAEAAGDYVLSMGADDILAQGYLPKAISAIREHRPAMVFSDIRVENVDFKTCQSLTFGGQARLWQGPELAASYRRLGHFIGGSTIHRRELLLPLVSTARELGPLFDFWVNHAIGFLYGAYYIPGEFSHFTARADSYGAQSRNRRSYRRFLEALGEPANRPLRDYFRQSTVLRLHGLTALLEILRSPRNFDLLTLSHVIHALKTWLLGPVRRRFPVLYGKIVAALRTR